MAEKVDPIVNNDATEPISVDELKTLRRSSDKIASLIERYGHKEQLNTIKEKYKFGRSIQKGIIDKINNKKEWLVEDIKKYIQEIKNSKVICSELEQLNSMYEGTIHWEFKVKSELEDKEKFNFDVLNDLNNKSTKLFNSTLRMEVHSRCLRHEWIKNFDEIYLNKAPMDEKEVSTISEIEI